MSEKVTKLIEDVKVIIRSTISLSTSNMSDSVIYFNINNTGNILTGGQMVNLNKNMNLFIKIFNLQIKILILPCKIDRE